MAGVKGRSGRRALSIEKSRHRVIDKAWDVIEKFLDSPDASLKEKGRIAIMVVAKDIPQKLEGDINHTVVMSEIQLDNRPHRFNIGDIDPSQNPRFTPEATANN